MKATHTNQKGRLLGSVVVSAGLLLTGLLVGVKPASADEAIVPFGGSLAGGCFFGSVTAGSLSFTGTPPTTVSGSGGSVPLTCTAAGTLAISAPTTTTSHTGTPSSSGTLTASVIGSFGTVSSGSSASVPASSTAYNLSVSMTHNNGSTPLTPGVYSYEVKLTATP